MAKANLILKTKVDNSDFDKKYKKMSEQLNVAEQEQSKLNHQIKSTNENLEKTVVAYEEASKKAKELYSAMKLAKTDGTTASEVKKIEKSYNSQVSLMERLETKIKSIESTQESQNIQLTKSKNKVKDINNNMKDLEDKSKKLQLKNFIESLKSGENSIGKITKKVLKWGAALFTVRSMYSALRQSAATLSEYNQDFANKLNSIKTTLALALAPVIETIVNMVYKLVQYAQYLIYGLTGYDIFKSAKDNLSSANKSAKELKKTMAGFDTAQTLGNNDSSSSGSSATAMSSLTSEDVPGWLQKIVDHAETVKTVLIGLFAGAAFLKITKGIKALMGVYALSGSGLLGLAYVLGILAAGVIITIAIQGAIEVKKSMDELHDAYTAIEEAQKNENDIIKETRDKYFKLAETTDDMTDKTNTYTNILKLNLDANKKLLDSDLLTYGQREREIEQMKNTIGYYKELYDRGMLNKEQEDDYRKYLERTIYALEQQGKDVTGLKTDYENLTGKKYETTCAIKTNADVSGAKKTYSNFFSKLGESFSHVLDISSWGSGWWSKMKSIWSSTPKLATGGIVNNPGHGVPVGSAIAGEAGREAVLPLTDSNTMSRLGEEIGKWISVNVDLTTKLDSRVLTRSLEKVQKNNSFTRNGV